ncbi:MAG: MerR family transcriptional regulator [Loktanella sp.]|nr:MerR family transcriptional regulator [Loktanella sp.]
MPKAKDAFRTISEVADWLDTPTHVLRFWETKFSQIRPVKGAGGRRYYRPSDMDLLGGIKQLLHEDGLTIKGTQKLLREKGVKYVATLGPSVSLDDDLPATQPIAVKPPAASKPAPAEPAPRKPEQGALPFADAAAAPRRHNAFAAPPAELPDMPGRLIGRAPVKAMALRSHLATLVPLLTRLAMLRDRLDQR